MAESEHANLTPEPLDPSLKSGHKLLMLQKIPIELRVQEEGQPSQVGQMVDIDCKLLALYRNKNLLEVRLEITTDADLFFNYSHFLNVDNFRGTQQDHKLLVNLVEYPDMLQRLLTNCANKPQEFICIFTMRRNGWARLDFVQNLKCKFLELLTCDFIISKQDDIRENVMYRYQLAKWELENGIASIKDATNLLKHNCPAILQKVFPKKTAKAT
jgi:Centriolar protein SAS N-terminal